MEPIYSDHMRIDERSLALHRLVARKLRANPALLDEARDNLRRWQKMEGSPTLTLSEWEDIPSRSAAKVAEFLEERSERATRLRQSSPFAGISQRPSAKLSMNRIQLEHTIRAASQISGDSEIVVIGGHVHDLEGARPAHPWGGEAPPLHGAAWSGHPRADDDRPRSSCTRPSASARSAICPRSATGSATGRIW